MKILKNTEKYEIILVSEIENPDNDSNDLLVNMADGRHYSATLFTLSYIQNNMDKHLKSGDSVSGNYFWTTDLLIMRCITEQEIIQMVEALINNGDIDTAMMQFDDESSLLWSEQHEGIKVFLLIVMTLYLGFQKSGKCYGRGLRMELDGKYYNPDITVVLRDRYKHLKKHGLNKAANIAIEIVSLQSGIEDRGDKYYQYQDGGVSEYWIIDPISKRIDVYYLDDESNYQLLDEATDKIISRQLEGFELDASILWQDDLPDGAEAVELVQAMLK